MQGNDGTGVPPNTGMSLFYWNDADSKIKFEYSTVSFVRINPIALATRILNFTSGSKASWMRQGLARNRRLSANGPRRGILAATRRFPMGTFSESTPLSPKLAANSYNSYNKSRVGPGIEDLTKDLGVSLVTPSNLRCGSSGEKRRASASRRKRVGRTPPGLECECRIALRRTYSDGMKQILVNAARPTCGDVQADRRTCHVHGRIAISGVPVFNRATLATAGMRYAG
jgi:hypothetical protein